MAREPDRQLQCRKCGEKTTHRVHSTRTGSGKVTRICKCEQCGSLHPNCGAD